MKFKDWLSEQRGRSALVARHFGVTQSAVNQWADGIVPPRRMAAIAAFTKGAVDLADMVPGAKPRRRKAEAA